MLRFHQITGAGDGATRYYTEALSRGDYHAEGGRCVGTWYGRAAERLGLAGEVTAEAFAALAHNRHPASGEQLTPSTKGNRTVGNDVTIDAPKSVSILWGLTGDERIREAVAASDRETVLDMERDMMTRVRRGGRQEDRVTGNAAIATFIHETARPGADGLSDMQLHAHNVFFNVTFDDSPEEQRFKAAQFRELRRDAPFYQAAFEARLAERLQKLGYAVEKRGKSWEIAGIDRVLVEKFSRRTQEIEQVAQERRITDAQQKSRLGARTRRKKAQDLSDGELRRYWASRLSTEEMRAVADVFDRAQERARAGGAAPGLTAGQSVDYACRHLFEKDAVVAERKLLAEALRKGVGSVTVEGVQAALGRAGLLAGERDGRRLLTTAEALAGEQRMIAFARDGRGARKPLAQADRPFSRDWLNQEQKAAVRQLWDSCSAVTLLRGGAGVGKTTLLAETVEGIEANGRKVFAFAPSAAASRGTLREAGFADAETMAMLLTAERLQERLRGQVALVDEAGLLSAKDAGGFFALAERLGARVIVVGDVRQHAAVERPGAMRLLETRAGLPVAEVREIQRQSGQYKELVGRLSRGDTEGALARLEALGWVREIADAGERERQLAADYVQALAERKKNGEHKTALVISPTHAEGERITQAIRGELKARGQLAAEERSLLRLDKRDLSEAERGEAETYAAGEVVQFWQNAKGFQRGERATVLASDAGGVRVQTAAGQVRTLPLHQAGRFQVYRVKALAVAAGDRVRITRNGFSKDGHRLDNGMLHTVAGVGKNGDLVLGNGWTVAANYGHLAHGYVITSHASQSKTVDRVFIGQSAESFPASSREQFYVSVSRGREQAVVYTDDKETLRDAVGRSDERLTATELLGAQARRRGRLLKHVEHLRRWTGRVRELPGRVAEAVRSHVREAGWRQREAGQGKEVEVAYGR